MLANINNSISISHYQTKKASKVVKSFFYDWTSNYCVLYHYTLDSL
jgi:hypothetical protein